MQINSSRVIFYLASILCGQFENIKNCHNNKTKFARRRGRHAAAPSFVPPIVPAPAVKTLASGQHSLSVTSWIQERNHLAKKLKKMYFCENMALEKRKSCGEADTKTVEVSRNKSKLCR